ncbi:hypothetical protein [Thermomicrobium sp.]
MRLCYDPADDVLVLDLVLPPQLAPTSIPTIAHARGLLDLTDRGSLAGLEIPLADLPPALAELCRALADDEEVTYVEIERVVATRSFRSVTVPIAIRWDGQQRLSLRIPRRTADYELLYPAGAT